MWRCKAFRFSSSSARREAVRKTATDEALKVLPTHSALVQVLPVSRLIDVYFVRSAWQNVAAESLIWHGSGHTLGSNFRIGLNQMSEVDMVW